MEGPAQFEGPAPWPPVGDGCLRSGNNFEPGLTLNWGSTSGACVQLASVRFTLVLLWGPPGGNGAYLQDAWLDSATVEPKYAAKAAALAAAFAESENDAEGELSRKELAAIKRRIADTLQPGETVRPFCPACPFSGCRNPETNLPVSKLLRPPICCWLSPSSFRSSALDPWSRSPQPSARSTSVMPDLGLGSLHVPVLRRSCKAYDAWGHSAGCQEGRVERRPGRAGQGHGSPRPAETQWWGGK